MIRIPKKVRRAFRWVYEMRIAFVALLVVAAFLYSQDIPARISEDIVFLIRPSAQRAYAYGDVHFRALNSRQYDIQRAEYWYEEALAIEPGYPGAHHQLARIEFLRGDYRKAITLINKEINLPGGPVTASSYYIRGLIEGYMGDYAASAKDYEKYLESDPHNWAAINDYAWVLLKAERFADAARVTEAGLEYFPDNPWLLNSSATALFELGKLVEAQIRAKKAYEMVMNVSERHWLIAYPGNDPDIAGQGVAAFTNALANNIHTIRMKIASSTVQ